MNEQALPSITLHQVAGPPAGPFVVSREGPVTIGRLATSDISLMDDAVSRRHAMLVRRRAQWFVIDEGSSGGTFVNGVRIPKSAPAPLATGDLVRIGPWAFRVAVGEARSRAAATVDDSGASTLRIQRAAGERGPSERRLRLLSETIAKLNNSVSEEGAARSALESALKGSGYARGAVLRRVQHGAGAPDEIEVVASHKTESADGHEFAFSRSLIEQANAGETVVLTEGLQPGLHGQSLAELNIHSALCVPVSMGGAVTGYLYLDARGRESQVRTDAAAFCEALTIAYGMAVANLQRAELARRQTELHAQLAAAREVQQLVMPPVRGDVGCVSYAMRSLPGSFVAGDLFDVVDVAGDGAAVCLGDVSGHGVGSAMLMASAQSFLCAELRRLQPGEDPAAAVEALNRYLCERPLAGRFMSLWVGILMPDGELTFVDAGHGHWVLVRADGSVERSPLGREFGGIPVGIDPDVRYPRGSVRLRPGERIIVYSDGIIEQRNVAGEPFGLERLRGSVAGASSPSQDIARLFDAFAGFGAMQVLDDDATAASLGLRQTT